MVQRIWAWQTEQREEEEAQIAVAVVVKADPGLVTDTEVLEVDDVPPLSSSAFIYRRHLDEISNKCLAGIHGFAFGISRVSRL